MKLLETDTQDAVSPLTEQAAHWWVVLNDSEPTGTDQRAFAEWVAKSPERIQAYLEVAALRKSLAKESVRWPATSAEELIREARASSGDVVPLGTVPRERAVDRVAHASHRRMTIAIAASVLLAVGAAWIWVSGPTQYRTELGEQRSVPLEDGSVVTLNTSTAIEIDLDDKRRVVRLTQGEALFQVAHDATRPFDVIAGDTTVRAVGTEFNVDRRESRTTVTVLEGRVLVDAVPVAAAEQVFVAETRVSTPERLDNLTPVTAWTQRRLIFDHRPLQEVAEEFNRYNREKIEINDPQLRAETVTGVFAANDATSFVAFLEQIPNVEIRKTADGTSIVTVGGPN